MDSYGSSELCVELVGSLIELGEQSSMRGLHLGFWGRGPITKSSVPSDMSPLLELLGSDD
jgi:hypothetical protein